MGREDPAVPVVALLDEDTRSLVVATVAGAALGWWPAFTLGVYGVIFFEQHLALWAGATSAFLALGYSRGPQVWRRPQVLALLLPSLWLFVAWILPVGGTSGVYQVWFWFGVVITVIGMPALAALMVRVLVRPRNGCKARRSSPRSAWSHSSCSRHSSSGPSIQGF